MRRNDELSDVIWAFSMVLLAFLAAIALVGCVAWLSTTAKAGDDDGWVRRTIRQERRHSYRSSSIHNAREHRRAETRVLYTSDLHWEPRCRERVPALGQEHASEDAARDAADRAWRIHLRFHCGEKYMDMKFASEVTYICARSSTNETAAGRVAEQVGGTYTRCEVTARPHRAPVIERER